MGQSQRDKIRNLFEQTSDGLWIYYYEGLFDDSFPMQLSLGKSGTHCHGFLKYYNNEFYFTVEGTIEDDVLTLEEYDVDDQHTGNIVLVQKNNQLIGQWTDIKGENELKFWLKKVKKIKEIPQECNSSFSIKYYSNKKVSLVLKKSIHKLNISFKEHNKKSSWTIFNNTSFKHEISLSHADIDYLFIPLHDDQVLIRINEHGKEHNFHLDLNKTINFDCKAMINFSSKGEAHYPHVMNKKFNLWMENWMDNIWKEQVDLLGENQSTPYERLEKEFFISTDITYFDDDFISGLVMIENKTSREISTKSFTYSFAKDREFDIDKIFKKKKKEIIFAKYEEKERNQCQNMQDGLKKAWLTNCEYDYVVFQDDGIALYTPYNLVFGNHYIPIPYEEILDKLRYTPTKHSN